MRPLKLSSLLFAGLGLMAVSHPAYAQSSDDEIVTTGVRQAYQGNFDTLEIPQINQALTDELMAEAGALTLDDALDLSASVARQNNFGGLWNSFSIRGFSGDINLPSGFLVNGFNAGRGFGGPRDIVGIETVEVLKGPRSALYGRGEPGGTINMVTKRPELTNGGYVQGTIGSWDQYRLEGDVQTTSGEAENIGVRLIGFFEDAESFREGKETQKHGFYPSVRYDISDNSTVSYELEYTAQELPQDRGVIFSEDFGYTPRDLFTGEPDALIETEVVGHQLEFQHSFTDNWSVLLGGGYRETSLVGDAYENNFGSRQPYLVDGETISRFFRYRDYQAEYLALRAEVSGDFNTGSLRHRLIAGVDYDKFDNDQFALRYRQAGIGGAASSTLDAETYLLLDVSDPVYGQYDRPSPAPNTDTLETLSGTGFYFQDQIDLTDKLQVRLGGRFDDFEQDLTNYRADPVSTSSSSNTYFSPQLGIVYAANDAVSLYGSYGEGIRQLSGNDFEGNSFDPNQTKSTEIGVKADLGGLSSNINGTVSATIFQVEQSNILVFDTRPETLAANGDNSFGDLYAAGEAQSQGFELDANVMFGDDLNLWLSYAYTDAVYTNGQTDAATFTSFEAGERMNNSPESQLSLQLTKGLQFEGMPAKFGGGVLYVGNRSGEVGGDLLLPSYTTMRLFGEIEPVESVSLSLGIDNIFDETYYTDSYANVWIQPGNPRRVRLSAAYEF